MVDSSEQVASYLPCDQSLARRLESAEGQCNAEFVEARAKCFPEKGCEWFKLNGTYVMFDGVGSPCTQTFGLGLFAAVRPADLATIEQFFHQRGSGVDHEISPLADPSLLGLLNEREYRPVEWSSVLYRPIYPGCQVGAPVDESVLVRRIDVDQYDLWAQTAASGWADVAVGLESFILEAGQANARRANTHCFLAEKQGETVAAAAVCLSDGIAVLAGACTVPQWRRQGAQLALLEHRLRFAADCGCSLAMIAAEPGSASQRNAERRGFRVAYTRIKWRRELPAVEDPQRVVVQQFTQQAQSFREFAELPGQPREIVRAVTELDPSDTVLDVACGPGVTTCDLAEVVAQATGIDVTPAMIDQARNLQRQRGLANVSWRVAAVPPLPFAAESFSLVFSRYSFHHFPDPLAVLQEMARVCQTNGRVVVIDVFMTNAAQANAYNPLEKLRDPSHVRALLLTELKALFGQAGLVLEKTSHYRHSMSLEPLLSGSFPNPGDAERVRQLIADDVNRNELGLGVHRIGDEIHFAYPIAVLVGRKT